MKQFIKKRILTIILFLTTFSFTTLQAQICNTSGNLMIYSNYDGGIVTINVDQNIPNLKIGICTYEPVQVTITGPFVGNVTQVLYAGFNSNQLNNNCGQGNFNTSISGVPAGIVTINPPLNPPLVGYTPAHGNGGGPWGGIMIGAAGQCDTTSNTGGVNTPDEIVYHFQTQMGGVLRAHHTQYSCWLNDTYNISNGGTCCILPPTSNPPSVSCNPGGNVMIYSNYEGGTLDINIDQNIPNLKIGICTYEATAVNFTGPFVGNITEVVYAGFNGNNPGCGGLFPTTTISGVPASIVSIYGASDGNIAVTNYFGEPLSGVGIPFVNCMVGAEGTCNGSNSGGGNSAPQIVQWFLSEFGPGSILYGHQLDYSCFAGPYSLSNGGNCCLETPTTPPNPIYTTGGTAYDFIIPTTYSLCAGPLSLDLSFYPVLFQPPTYPGYVWSDGTTGPSITISTPGTYFFTAGDYCHYGGNFLTDTIVVTACCTPPVDPVGNVSSQPTCNSPTGSIEVTSPIGPSFEYSIDGVNFQTTTSFSGLAAGSYTLIVREISTQCICLVADTLEIVPNLSSPTLSILSFSNPTCSGQTNGSISVNASGGTGPYSYTWSPNVSTTNNAINLGDGSYEVLVTDNLGCTAVITQTLATPAAAVITETISNPTCEGDLGSITTTISSASTISSYAWSTGANSQSISGLSSGTYTLTIVDAFGCSFSETYNLSLTGNLTLTANPSTSTINEGDSVLLTVAGANSFVWSPGTNLSCISCSNPIANPTTSTTYLVTGTDLNGCTGSTLVQVNVVEICGDVFVPTIFSPDDAGNSVNNQCCVFGNCIQSFTYQIFDRWGKKVFETSDQTTCWNGTLNDVKLNAGSYVYKLVGTLNSGVKFEQAGNLTLIR